MSNSHMNFAVAEAREIRQEVARALERTLDPLFSSAGFLRRGGATKYSRKTAECRQTVYFDYSLRPSRRPGTIQLLPQVAVTFPKVNALAASIVTEDAHGFSESYEFTEKFMVVRLVEEEWFPRDIGELEDLLNGDVYRAMHDIVLPVLARVETVSQYASISSADAEVVILCGRGRWFTVAVAKLLIGDPQGALALIREHYSNRDPFDGETSYPHLPDLFSTYVAEHTQSA